MGRLLDIVETVPMVETTPSSQVRWGENTHRRCELSVKSELSPLQTGEDQLASTALDIVARAGQPLSHSQIVKVLEGMGTRQSSGTEGHCYLPKPGPN